MVNINKIINVDFNIASKVSPLRSYDTVVYLVSPTTGGQSKLKNAVNLSVGGKTFKYVLCSSLESVDSCFTSRSTSDSGSDEGSGDPTGIERCSASNFFRNGGGQLLILEVTAENKGALDSCFKNLHELLTAEGSDFIYVCLSSAAVAFLSSTDLKGLITAAEDSKSPYTYRLLLTTSDTSKYNSDSEYSAYSIGVKYCTKAVLSDTQARVVDAALLIGAYYSQVNLDGSESIKDYCYTSETLENVLPTTNVDFTSGVENVSDSVYDTLIGNQYNFIDQIGKNIVNFGGNLLNGTSIHLDFATCAAENDITNAVLSSMLKKQYLTAAGLNTVLASIDATLVRYMSNGYLELGSLYSGDDIICSYNGVNHTIIKKGTSLSKGYLVTAIPIANISDQDKLDKRFTPIFVIMQTQSGARVIEISGEVR